MSAQGETARQIAEQFRMALVRVGADRECGVHESPEAGCCFCAWEAITDLLAALAQARQDAASHLERANQEIARRERAEIAYTQSEQKRLVLIDALAAAEQARDEALKEVALMRKAISGSKPSRRDQTIARIALLEAAEDFDADLAHGLWTTDEVVAKLTTRAGK